MSVKDMLRVLVVDDHVSSRMVTVDALSGFGIRQIMIAKDGQDAFNKAVQSPVHIIISDLHMPNVDGFQLIKAVRSHPQISRTAVIILTGTKDLDVVRKAKSLGVNNVLAKPFTPVGLKSALESVVGKLA